MQSFLEEVADQCLKNNDAPENLIFVLPSKRAGSFLRQILVKKATTTTFSPRIFSIEEFVEQISGLAYSTNTRLMFDLYKAYLGTNPKDTDSFDNFCKWGQTLLQDFNEIDRYLVVADKLFSYLADVRKMEQWTVSAEKTPLMEGYIRFWNTLGPIYHKFRDQLLREGRGYQGLIYRKACELLESYMVQTTTKRHIFLGFNALNKAESTIIEQILQKGNAEIYWDADVYYTEDPIHEAGYFIRRHQREWEVLSGKPLQGLSNYFLTPKSIQVTGIPKNVAQTKYVGKLLHELGAREDMALENTAVVLGDEGLLNPLLHSIPKDVNTVNITMGFPLQKSAIEGLFSRLFELHMHKGPRGWFFKDVLALIAHPLLEPLYDAGPENSLQRLQHEIKYKNWVYLTLARIQSIEEIPADTLNLLFFDQNGQPKEFIGHCIDLVHHLRSLYQQPANPMVLEELYRFYTIFNQLNVFLDEYGFVSDLKSLFSLYKTLLASETIDFRGEPLQGLQIMGMLESRNLDFETVIITSVNEGILPSGKSNNSFIPYDLKLEFGLPTFKEKDAVYSYHFYRLLQRAKNIYLLYNTEPDVLEGGEKSRLIAQLFTDPRLKGQISHSIASPRVQPDPGEPFVVAKDHLLMAQLQALAERGFSPSSLTNYIRNPIDFYKKSILGIDEALEVEESITANVFGTVIHGALEELYKPFVGQYLSPDKLDEQRSGIQNIVRSHFNKAYTDTDISQGKNLIAYQVLVHYVGRFLDLEIAFVKKNSVRILSLEQEIQMSLDVPGLNFPVRLKGIIDRIDEVNGIRRIIDYKSGNVLPGQVAVKDWNELTTNYDQSKAFQLLTYAYMYQAEFNLQQLQAGIISIKNLSSGIFYFSDRDTDGVANKQMIDSQVLGKFRESLNLLLFQIFDKEQLLEEKPV